jgi:hypothetical protein
VLRGLLQRRFVGLWLVAALVLIAAAIGAGWDFAAARKFFREGETVENLTLAAYLVAIALLILWSHATWQLRIYTALVLAFFALREMELPKAFTSDSIMKLSYYARGEDPILARVLAGAVMLVILAVLIRYLWFGRPLLAALLARRPFADSALIAVALVPGSKVLDSILGLMAKHLGHQPTDNERLWLGLFEETLELAIPLMVILAVVQFNAAAQSAAESEKTQYPLS